MEIPLLNVQGICKRFGALQVLDHLNLQVPSGQITGIIGPNGAGKTTLFSILSGFLPLDAGEITLAGQSIQHLPAHRRVAHGLVRTFQITRVLAQLSVLDNLVLAAPNATGEQIWQVFLQPQVWRHQQRTFQTQALEILEVLGLAHQAREKAGNLSGGQRKLLELGRSLMTHPRLLLLDEPAAGVNPSLIEKLCQHIQTWNQAGITFLIIEHNMDMIMSLCDHIWVLAEGKNLVDDSPAVIQQHPLVLEAYLGQ